jgi:hypothetical protein
VSPPGSRSRLAAGLTVTSAVLVAAGLAAAVAIDPADVPDDSAGMWSMASFAFPIAAFSGVGGLIAWRLPGNLIGWLLAVIGLLFAVVVASTTTAEWALTTGDLPNPVGEWISVAANAWVPALGLTGTQLALRLPDGHVLSQRWRTYSRVTLLLIALSTVAMSVQPGRVNDLPGTANPVGVEGAEPFVLVFLLVLLSFIGSTASLVIRYRRAGSQDRVRLRWVAFGGVVFLAIYFLGLLMPPILGLDENGTGGDITTGVSQAAFAVLPIAIGYAMLRHRLYDIDVVINRALVYTTLTVTLAATYLGVVLLLQLALDPVTGGSNLAIAGSTLAVAGVFRPARGRIQALVDRRFFRRRYDAARTLEGFSSRLRDQVELEALNGILRGVVSETMQPAHVSLWLRAPGSDG